MANPSRLDKIQITGNSNSGTATKVNVQEANGEVNTQAINTAFNKNFGLNSGDVIGADNLLNQYSTVPSNWVAQAYTLGSIVFYGGKQWYASVATVAGDVPNVSTKWKDITFEGLYNMPSGGVWGSITGTLSDQSDLQSALNAKAPIANPSFTGAATSPAFITQGGTTLQFVDGTGALQAKSQFQNAISGTADYLTKFGIGGVVQSIISENGYAIGINGNDLNPNIGDPKHAFDVTNNAGDNFQYLAQFTSYANSSGLANFHIRKARGTSTAPLAVQSQDILASFGFRGHATNKFASSSIAIQAIAEENFTNTANGTSLLFQTTPIGNFDSRVDALKLQANGSFLFFKGGEVVSPNTSSPSLTLKGGSTIGSSDTQSGELVVGSNSLYRGKFSYNGQEGKLYIDNSYNDTNGDIVFRTKSNATPINALIIKGEGNIQANGTISASPAITSNQVPTKAQLDLKADLASPNLTGVPTAPTATLGTNTTQIATTSFVLANGARPYKVYTALLSQTGTNAPTATILENTTGQTVTLARVNVGVYQISLTAPQSKTFVLSTPASNHIFQHISVAGGGTAVNISTASLVGSTITSTDGLLQMTPIEIRVYN